MESLLLGMMLGGISSDVIIPLTKKLTMNPETSLDLTLESAISDVFSIVGTITLLNLIALDSFSFGFAVRRIVNSFAVAIFIGTVFGLFWVKIQDELNKFEKSYMVTIAAVLLLYSFVEYMESNGAIACLAFGIILGNSHKIFSLFEKEKEYNVDPSEKFFFAEISFFVKTFFFVYLGIILSFTSIGYVALGFLLSLLLYFIRPLAYAIVYRKKPFEPKDRAFMEVITPKGLAAAVLAQFPLRYGIEHGIEFPVIAIYVIIFSILLSTIGVFLIEKTHFRGFGESLDLRKLGRRAK